MDTNHTKLKSDMARINVALTVCGSDVIRDTLGMSMMHAVQVGGGSSGRIRKNASRERAGLLLVGDFCRVIVS